MKTRVLFFLIVLSCSSVFLSCKKGEDDPAVSLVSRKARMAGNWKLNSGTLKVREFLSSSASATEYNYTFSSSTFNYSSSAGGGIVPNIQFHLDMSISKNGEITINQQMDTASFSFKGNWDFTGKVGNSKNKDGVRIVLSSTSDGSGWLDRFNKALTVFTYKIKELRNKKLVLHCEDEFIQQYKDGSRYFITAEYIFEQ